MADQPQLYVIILGAQVSIIGICAQIESVGGTLESDLDHNRVVLANLTPLQAGRIASSGGVQHVAPVGVNHRVKRLRIQLGPDGRPLWRFETRNNDIARVSSGTD